MCKTIEKITLWILFFQAHELMSPRELSQVFQVEDQDNVPEYEVVNIHHRRHKRDTDTSSVHQVTIIIHHLHNQKEFISTLLFFAS